MPAPRIGRVVSRSTATTIIAHTTKSHERLSCTFIRDKCTVARNVSAPASDEAPRTWSDSIAIETAFDEEKSAPVSGKYSVQPAESPDPVDIATRSSSTARTDNQKAKLLSLGVAKSRRFSEEGTK